MKVTLALFLALQSTARVLCETTAVEPDTPICPAIGQTSLTSLGTNNRAAQVGYENTYHSETSCNLPLYNKYKESMQRWRTYRYFKARGTMQTIPEVRTVTCPNPANQQSLHLPAKGKDKMLNNNNVGFDTMWIVRNTASTPVVLAYVQQDENGMEVEYSSEDPTITPPQKDPRSIMQPGTWRAIYAHEGHVFHVRPLLADGVSTGPLILQHRTGLVPVGQHFAKSKMHCPAFDEEPLDAFGKLQTKFRRTPNRDFRPCHTIDVGFRNMSPCPLHAYYVHYPLTNATKKERKAGKQTVECDEEFKFHLGTQTEGLEDPFHQWQSVTKFEGSYLGHSFVFRLASDPNVVVDTATLLPTEIVDCPFQQVAETVEITVPLSEPQHVFMAHSLNATAVTNRTRSNRVAGNATSSIVGATIHHGSIFF